MILKRSFDELKTDSRVLKEASSLKSEGHEVTIVIFGDKYSCNNVNTKFNDINVKRAIVNDIFLFKKYNQYSSTYKRSFMRPKILYMALSYLFSYIYFLKYFASSLSILIKEDADVYHANDFETLHLATICSYINNKKIVYDSHELWVESRKFATSIGKFEKPFTRIIENFLIKKADAVITVNNSIAEYLSNCYCIVKPTIVSNFPEYTEITNNNDLRNKLGLDNETKIILYHGAIFKGRGLESLLECSKYIQGAVIVIMGNGYLKDWIKQKIVNDNLLNVKMLDYVPKNVLVRYISSADVGVVPIENICLSYYLSLPNKVGECIMAGIPFASSDFPELNKLALGDGVGVVFDPNDICSITDALKSLLSPKVYNSKKMNVFKNRNKYSWDNEQVKLIDVYNKLKSHD